MDLLITVTWRSWASPAQNKAAAQVVHDRLIDPYPGVTIVNSVADLGKRKLYVIADVSEAAMQDIRNTLELTTQPAIESVETSFVVNGKKAINTYLKMG